MYNLSRNVKLSQKIKNCLTYRRTASNKAKDPFHQPDASPEELRLISERLKIKKALRAEYLRKATDPHSTDPIIFDPMVQRYYSMHMTIYDRFIPTFKNWCLYMSTSVLPVVLIGLYFRKSKNSFERKCRSGEISYADRYWKFQ